MSVVEACVNHLTDAVDCREFLAEQMLDVKCHLERGLNEGNQLSKSQRIYKARFEQVGVSGVQRVIVWYLMLPSDELLDRRSDAS